MKKGDCPASRHPLLHRDETLVVEHASSHAIWLASSLRRIFQGGCAAVLIMVSACSSGTSVSQVQVGQIAFTDANGTPLKTPPGSLTAGQGAYVDVALSNDPQQLGANWTVYCGSAPAPGTPPPPGETQDETCGTFTPGHTMSGPIPSFVTNGAGYVAFYVAPAAPPKDGTVTLYAVSTSSPNKFSSVSLSIDGNPISVSLAPAPLGSLNAGISTQLRAVLNNDPANAGVNWTVICGSTDCGSFKPSQTGSGIATTYTAPAVAPTGGIVQVTATSITDPTKAASATISIM